MILSKDQKARVNLFWSPGGAHEHLRNKKNPLKDLIIRKALLVEFMMQTLNVDLYLGPGLDTVSMGIYALNYIATKQIKNVQQ